MLCLDVSGSMTAQDFSPNRMRHQKVAIDFVQKDDLQIGVVIFSGESFTLCPLDDRSQCGDRGHSEYPSGIT